MNSQEGRGTNKLMATLKKIPTIMGHGVKEKIILTLVKMIRETFMTIGMGYCNRGETWGSTPNMT